MFHEIVKSLYGHFTNNWDKIFGLFVHTVVASSFNFKKKIWKIKLTDPFVTVVGTSE